MYKKFLSLGKEPSMPQNSIYASNNKKKTQFMKKRLFFIFSIFLLGVFMATYMVQPLEATSSITKTNDILPENLTKKHPIVTRLCNGLTVLVLEDSRFPLVSTRLYVHAGSAYEKPEQSGISHILEHMVFKGTESRPNATIGQEVEAVGGYLNAATSYDYTIYKTDMPSSQWKLGMDVVRDMAFHPMLDPQDLESEKKVILAELARGEDNPHSFAFKKLLAKSLAGTPYSRPIIGYPETINAVTSQDLKDYIATHYQPQDMLLVVVGDVKANEVLQEANHLFSKYKNTQNITLPLPYYAEELPLKEGQGTVTIIPGTWNKVYLTAAVPVSNALNIESNTLDVLAQLLGGDKTSLFYRTYKHEKQLVEDIQVTNYSFERTGVFLITAEVEVNKIRPFWDTLTKDLANLSAKKFSQQELDRAKLNLEDDLYRTKETLPGLASKLGYFEFFLNGEEGEKNTIEAIHSVDIDMLDEAISKWIRPERFAAVVLPPKDVPMPNLQATLEKNWPKKVEETTVVNQSNNKEEIIKLGKKTVVLIPDNTLPYCSVTLLFSGGDALVSDKQQGLPALTATVLTKGTSNKTVIEIQNFLADRAADLSASAGRKTFSVTFTGPSKFNNELFPLVLDVIKNPEFFQSEVSRGIQDQIAAIKSQEDQPLGLAFRKIPPFLFPHSVYGYMQLGSPEVIKKFTQQDIKKFWEKQIAQPWVLAIAGQFDREKILQFVKDLPEPVENKIVVPEPSWGKERELDINIPGRNQAHLLLIYKTVPDTNPETPIFNVMETVLSGQGGLLFRDLRDEQALGYTVTAFNRQTTETGYLGLYIGTEPNKISVAEKGFKDTIQQSLIDNLLPEAELNRAKNQIEGEYYRERQSLGSRASEAAILTLENRPLNYAMEQVKKATHVTAQQIKELAQRYLLSEKPYIVKILP